MKKWKHLWRVWIRQKLYAQLASRQERFAPLHGGVNRKASKLLWMITENTQWKHHLQMILSGAQITACSRHWMKKQQSDTCEHCHVEPETQQHRMMSCQEWASIREVWTPMLESLPPDITMTYGIVPAALTLSPNDLLVTQAMLLHISLCATLADTKSEDDNLSGAFVLPDPSMVQEWKRHRLCRDIEEDVDMPSTQHVTPDANLFTLGQHMVRRLGERLACEDCTRTYSVRHAYRYAHVPCERMQRPSPAILPKPLELDRQTWQIPRHSKRPHVYVVAADKKITCKICRSRWQWSQRHRLAFSICAGSTHAEQARRAQVDWNLPLMRKGHIPAMHTTGRYLTCLACGLDT